MRRALPWILALSVHGCHRPPTAEPDEARLASARLAPGSRPDPSARAAPDEPPPPARWLGGEEALALVRALPEVRTLETHAIPEGSKVHSFHPVTRITQEADERCRDGSCAAAWEVGVADAPAWGEGSRLREDQAFTLVARVDAVTGEIALRDDTEAFVPRESWLRGRDERRRLTRLVMSLPEWQIERRRVARRHPGASLGLLVDGSPAEGCAAGESRCRHVMMALSVCGGCAGHWVRFSQDVAHQGPLLVGFGTEEPYEVWRNRARAEPSEGPLDRPLTDERARFPERAPGQGPLGYGAPSSVVADPAAFRHPTRAVLDAAGLRLTRVERYRKDTYPVFFVEPPGPWPASPAEFRAWAARLVRKNGGHSCELVVAPRSERYQIDPFVEEPGEGGVYLLRGDAFEPWLD